MCFGFPFHVSLNMSKIKSDSKPEFAREVISFNNDVEPFTDHINGMSHPSILYISSTHVQNCCFVAYLNIYCLCYTLQQGSQIQRTWRTWGRVWFWKRHHWGWVAKNLFAPGDSIYFSSTQWQPRNMLQVTNIAILCCCHEPELWLPTSLKNIKCPRKGLTPVHARKINTPDYTFDYR